MTCHPNKQRNHFICSRTKLMAFVYTVKLATTCMLSKREEQEPEVGRQADCLGFIGQHTACTSTRSQEGGGKKKLDKI